ncbi:hypothetical protein V2G26_020358 [Clonostachys chloroleuca]
MRIVILCHLHSRFFYQLAPTIALPACLTLFSLLLFFFFCSGIPPQLPLIPHYFFSSSHSSLRSLPFPFSTNHRETTAKTFPFHFFLFEHIVHRSFHPPLFREGHH